MLDEAQHLRDSFFLDLAGFLNRNLDRREVLTVWLVGLPSLAARLVMRQPAGARSSSRLEALDRRQLLVRLLDVLSARTPPDRAVPTHLMDLLSSRTASVKSAPSRRVWLKST